MHRRKPISSFQRPPATVRRRRRALESLVLLGSVLGAFAGAAQTAPQSVGRATIDLNGDGVLDEQELRAAVEVTFETADANKDGYLTTAEIGAARMAGDVERTTRGLGGLLGTRGRNAETAAQRFERLDADGDGRVSRKEFVDASHPLLRFDADGDGRLTREEIERGRDRAHKALGPLV